MVWVEAAKGDDEVLLTSASCKGRSLHKTRMLPCDKQDIAQRGNRRKTLEIIIFRGYIIAIIHIIGTSAGETSLGKLWWRSRRIELLKLIKTHEAV